MRYILAASAALLLTTAPAAAEFPDKPIKIQAPYAPGGNVDVTARIVADKLASHERSCVMKCAKDGKDLPPLTLIRVEAGEATPELAAGPNGAEVLIMQLPKPTARIGSDPAELAKRDFGSYDAPPGMIRN